VIVVHLYGQMPDMDSLCCTADRAGVLFIEDAAQAHGATWRDRRAGSIGRAVIDEAADSDRSLTTPSAGNAAPQSGRHQETTSNGSHEP
jgi:hypothetical protein